MWWASQVYSSVRGQVTSRTGMSVGAFVGAKLLLSARAGDGWEDDGERGGSTDSGT